MGPDGARAQRTIENWKEALKEGLNDHPPLLAGVYAALAAEVVFIAVVFAMSLFAGLDPWRVFKMPASFLIGPAATSPEGFVSGDVFLGLLMHLLLASVVGVLYALLLGPLQLSPMAGGLLAAGLLYMFGFWLLPALFPDWLEPFRLPVAGKVMQAIAHLIYGVTFGLFFARLTG